MMFGLPELVILCRDLSINPLNQYQACCDYYGLLDEVHILVSKHGFRNHAQCEINIELKLSGDDMNQKLINDTVKKLKGLCSE